MTLTRWILPVLILCAACARSAEAPDIEPVSPAPGAEGIDLSHHNGRIDWDRLGEAPLDFIYLKATEGRDWKDPRFQDNWLE
ncbi:MAG: hypothetical protein KDA39_04740, partial [Hyphomonas sp.]|nr:hypothetical protein [Hyphomonas sp.]